MTNKNETRQKQQLLFWPPAASVSNVVEPEFATEQDSFEKSCPDCDAILEQYYDDMGNCKYQCDNCNSGIFNIN